MKCPNCHTNNPEQARFCSHCGQDLVHRCSNCQTELPQAARFCMACGQPVLVETATDASRLSRITAAVPPLLEHKIRMASKVELKSAAGALGEQRTITALLVDVVGSSGLIAKLGDDNWTKTIDRAYELIAPIIYQYEGTIVRILGDSLLAFFGAPVAHEDDPVRAVRTGMDIVEQVQAFSLEFRQHYNMDFVIRVCINTGPVVIGPVADDLSYDYSTGEGTVNLTSRIKFASQALSVLVTANTYRFIAPYFVCDDLGSLDVKGLEIPVEVFQVKSSLAVPGRVRGFKDLVSPLVGREAEMATLKRLCEAVRVGLGRAVLIMGEPGMGKTRLIQEWRQEETRQPDSPDRADPPDQFACGRWVTGRCMSYSQAVPYRLMIDMIRNLIGVTYASSEAEARLALIDLTIKLLGDQAKDVYPYIGHLLSIKLEGEDAERAQINDPQALQTQYLQALQTLFHACMARNPLILVLEDLHWADAASIELFTKLLPLVSAGPILFCLVIRPERNSAGWRLVQAARELLASGLTEINLGALNEKESRLLVGHLLELDSLPIQVRELILRKAEGNPYFVEEVIRMLIERGTIINQGGAWVAQKQIYDRDIPDNLQGLLLARIDQLPPEARYTLMVASVIGRSFPVRVLSQVISGV